MKNFINRSYEVLKSQRLFIAILAFFIFEAVWIALSAIYPMAFDEDFHFGLIKVYSHYWLPFLSTQPPNANAFGAVARDPSYLYHYLMSFPYRIIATFVHDQTMQVIYLRLINVALFSTGLVLFRKVLLKANLSVAFTNVSMLLFILIPITPQLAAQINYDNLLFPLVAWTCLLTFEAVDGIRNHKPNAKTLLTLLAVCLFSSLVKYAYVPIFAAAVLFLSYVAYRKYKLHVGKFLADFWISWKNQSKIARVALILLAVLGIGMFCQRDGYNLVKYHNFTPNCSQILSIQQCSAYSVWYSEYLRHQWVVNNPGQVNYDNPMVYLLEWFYWLGYRLFFAINGVNSSYTNYPPLPLPIFAAFIIGMSGAVAVFIWKRSIFHNNPYLAFFFVASLLYLISLLLDGYSSYRYTDTLVGMNGRYLLPVLLLVAAILGRGLSFWFKTKSSILKPALTLLVILLFLEGGGLFTFISRSDSSWDWPNSTIVKVNNVARKVTKPVIIKGSKSYSTPLWVFN